MTKKLMIPNKEIPVSSAQMPKVPPKLAILSLNVVLASKTVISTIGFLYLILTMMRFFTVIFNLLNSVFTEILLYLKEYSFDQVRFFSVSSISVWFESRATSHMTDPEQVL